MSQSNTRTPRRAEGRIVELRFTGGEGVAELLQRWIDDRILAYAGGLDSG